MGLFTFNFTKLDKATYAITRAAWGAQLDSLSGEAKISTSSYDSLFLLLEQWLDSPCQNPKQPFYAVTDPATGCAKAIIAVSYVPLDECWLKILDTKIEPRLEAIQEEDKAHDISSSQELANLGAYIIVECLALTYNNHPAKTMKMMCQSPLDAQYLEGLISSYAALNSSFASVGIKIKTYKNWIQFDKA